MPGVRCVPATLCPGPHRRKQHPFKWRGRTGHPERSKSHNSGKKKKKNQTASQRFFELFLDLAAYVFYVKRFRQSDRKTHDFFFFFKKAI